MSFKHKCTVCKYSTNDLSNFNKHIKSKKHTENVKKQEKKRVNKLNKIENKQTDDTTNAIILDLQRRLDNKEREIDKYTDLFKMQFEILKGQTDAANKSMSAVKYLAKYRTTAPAIKPLKGNELTKMITYRGSKHYTLADIVVHNYNHKTMHKFLGDIIVDKYKTDEPDDQSVWMSDLSRLSFIIRELKDGNPEWVKDKSGIKLTKLIITPLMEKVKEMLIDHTNKLDELNNDPETDEIEAKENVKIMQKINEIVRDINMNKFNNSILRHIAPEFNLDIT
jgi:hypothetical protein